MGNNNAKEAGAGAGNADANANLQELRQNLEQLQGLLLQGRAGAGGANHDDADPGPPPRNPIVGDVCFVQTDSRGQVLAKIVDIKDNEVTARIVGTDMPHIKPTCPVENISKVRFREIGMNPYYEGPLPNWNAQQIRDQERKRRQERDHVPDTISTYQYEDEEIVFNVLRNNIQAQLKKENRRSLSWCFQCNLVMYRGGEFLERIKARLNHEVCLPVGFELVFLGPDPVMGKKHVGLILEEREIPEEN